MNHKKTTVDANKIVQYCCVMVMVAIILAVFTDAKNNVDNIEDTFVPQVGIWTCWILLIFMGGFGVWHVFRQLLKYRRRGRSS